MGGIQETDTAKFLTRHPIPAVSSAERIAESLDAMREAINDPSPSHTDITENQELCAVIDRLKGMHGGEGEMTATTKDDNATTPRIDSHQQGHRQQHGIGTRIKVMERLNGKCNTHCGAATSFDPSAGLSLHEV